MIRRDFGLGHAFAQRGTVCFGLITSDVFDLDPRLPFGTRVIRDLIGVRASGGGLAHAGAGSEQRKGQKIGKRTKQHENSTNKINTITKHRMAQCKRNGQWRRAC